MQLLYADTAAVAFQNGLRYNLRNRIVRLSGKNQEIDMDCVSAQQMIRPYLGGYLSDKDLEAFLDHVENCPACFSELEVYFSVYRTLNNVDEKGDYNYSHKLRAKLRESREYLRKRYRNKAVKVSVIVAAELAVGWAFWGLLKLPGGYIDKHRTELIPVVETEYHDILHEGMNPGNSTQVIIDESK